MTSIENELLNLVKEKGIVKMILENKDEMEYKDIIEKYDGDWGKISRYQTLSEDFVRDFKDKVDWLDISIHQTLSENFIIEFQDRICWWRILRFQLLSEDFKSKFQDRICWDQ